MTPEQVRAHIKKLVDDAPPLSESQRARLAMLLRPAQAERTRTPVTAQAAEKKAKAA